MTPGNGDNHAVSASGRLVAVAGQVAMDEHGELVGPGDPIAKTERVFENLGLALTDSDRRWSRATARISSDSPYLSASRRSCRRIVAGATAASRRFVQ